LLPPSRLGRALGVTVKVLPYWGELTVQLDDAPVSQIVPAKPLGVDMGRVLAVTTVIDQVCRGTLPAEAAQSGGLFGFTAVGVNLAIAGSSPPVPLLIDVVAAGCAVASFGTFFSIPWRLLALPIATGMLAHAARWARISVAGGSAPTGALVACMLVSVLVTPIVDRLHLPFAAVAFSAVVSLMPGFFLFNAATGLAELVSIGPSAPAALLTSIVTNGATAFLIIMAMTFGLILPRMLFERVVPAPA
jgi:uncharacterized membrane protein YjjB (DUF3815 family)